MMMPHQHCKRSHSQAPYPSIENSFVSISMVELWILPYVIQSREAVRVIVKLQKKRVGRPLSANQHRRPALEPKK